MDKDKENINDVQDGRLKLKESLRRICAGRCGFW